LVPFPFSLFPFPFSLFPFPFSLFPFPFSLFPFPFPFPFPISFICLLTFTPCSYSNVVKEDAKTQRLKQLPHEWKSITALSTQQVCQFILFYFYCFYSFCYFYVFVYLSYTQAAELIFTDQIDILVELAGHTSGNRLDVVALRPAPIQITYLLEDG
jgi:hypothetical protein